MKAGLRTTTVGALVMAALVCGWAGLDVAAQRNAPAEVAAKLSGTWKFNPSASPDFKVGGPPAAPRGGGAPAFAISAGAARAAFAQRGGRGGGGGGAAASPEEVAGMNALRQYQQLAETLTIKATAENVTIVDPRGERTFAIDNKTVKVPAGGAEINAKSRWDGPRLRQEFGFGEMRVTQTWQVNDKDQLELRLRVEDFRSERPSTGERKAVYDRQP
jgi:hypothetical protein